ncbi:hypothetical protein [Marinobacter zhejiangensis]|uniref:Uncharacterized protein n=1 Tax=Marinobacter zhejiangensis TaxID=488535 RepID=A0A1I4QG85_9GAMM|nr:hypothetical protein [Marinobacter zhejiangensis]SFM39101.1 hypothetical protein SAMN04487963_2377 [Marinobacter zhejiangensis]
MTSSSFNPREILHTLKSKLLTVPALALLAGCSANPIYTTTGVVLSNYSEGEATPYVLQMSDTSMACSLGEGIDPLLYSFSRVTSAPDSTGALLMLLAANCSEQRAWEAELSYLRADYQGNVPAAKDARERMKRMNAEIATRRYEAFQRAMRAYDYDPNEANPECPFLYEEQDEFTFLIGLVTGMQAIVNDANSGSMAGVPRNIAPQAERAAQCLDNEKWAGLPNAIRALVWLLIPDTQPALAPDPWRVFDDSARLGIESGLRISMALQAVAAETFGRPDVLEEVLKQYTESEDSFTVNDDYRLVDTVAGEVLLFSSDKYWTEHYGYRTPQRYFGLLSEQRAGEDTPVMSLDDLL